MSLLFSLYINDITEDIISELRLFANDPVCYREIKDSEDMVKLKEDIDRLGCRVQDKELGHEIPARQMQYNAEYKETDQAIPERKRFLIMLKKIKYLGITIINDLK